MCRRSNIIALAVLALLTGCGGSTETAESSNAGPVAAKAVADVDAAMADAQRARTPAPAQNQR